MFQINWIDITKTCKTSFSFELC